MVVAQFELGEVGWARSDLTCQAQAYRDIALIPEILTVKTVLTGGGSSNATVT